MNNRERLHLILEAVEEKMRNVEQQELTEEGAIFLEVSGALLRGCVDAGRGVRALAAANEVGGSTAVMRAGFEMWRELDFILRSDNAAVAAVRAKAHAYLQVLGNLGPRPPENMRANNQAGLDELERRFPEAVREAREHRRGHWSGEGTRTDVVTSRDENLKRIYKYLSWESHPETCFIRDISAEVRAGRHYLHFHSYTDAERILEQTAWAVGEYVQRAWNDFAIAWGQEKIDFPLPEAP